MADGSTSRAARGVPTVADEYRVKASGDGLDFTAAMVDAIEGFNAELDSELKEAVHAGGKATRTHMRSNSPKRTGAYSRSWGCDFEDRDGHHEATVSNRKHYQLTHLLEDGHEIHNQYGGSYGRVKPAQPENHIANAAEQGKQKLEQKLGVRL